MLKSLFILLLFIISTHQDPFINTTWTNKIGNGYDKLVFKKTNEVNEFSYEMNYTFHSSYTRSKDTLIILTKDDSHSEDHGKIEYSKIKYLIRGRFLYPVAKVDLIKGKWIKSNFKFLKNSFFTKSL